MKKLLVYLPQEFHEDLKEIAHRRKTTMAELVRKAIEQAYEDDFDALLGERALAEHLADPSGSISLSEYMAQTNGARRS